MNFCVKTRVSSTYVFWVRVEFLNRRLKYVIVMAKLSMTYCDVVQASEWNIRD